MEHGRPQTQEAPMKTVREILNAKGDSVLTVAPDASVFEALELMADRDVGALVVVEGEAICGLLSERDYACASSESSRSETS